MLYRIEKNNDTHYLVGSLEANFQPLRMSKELKKIYKRVKHVVFEIDHQEAGWIFFEMYQQRLKWLGNNNLVNNLPTPRQLKPIFSILETSFYFQVARFIFDNKLERFVCNLLTPTALLFFARIIIALQAGMDKEGLETYLTKNASRNGKKMHFLDKNKTACEVITGVSLTLEEQLRFVSYACELRNLDLVWKTELIECEAAYIRDDIAYFSAKIAEKLSHENPSVQKYHRLYFEHWNARLVNAIDKYCQEQTEESLIITSVENLPNVIEGLTQLAYEVTPISQTEKVLITQAVEEIPPARNTSTIQNAFLLSIWMYSGYSVRNNPLLFTLFAGLTVLGITVQSKTSNHSFMRNANARNEDMPESESSLSLERATNSSNF